VKPLPLTAFICLLAFAGCVTQPPSDSLQVLRIAPTGFAPGDRVAVLLSSYEIQGVEVVGDGREKGNPQQREAIETRLEDCLKQAMLSSNTDLIFSSSPEVRATLFLGNTVGEISQEPEKLLRWASEPEFSKRLASLQLRYLVVLDGSSWASEGAFGGGGFLLIAAAGYSWTRHSNLRATVLDVAHRRIAGRLSISDGGLVTAGVAIYVIVPVPFFAAPDPESRTCTELGKGLAQFIAK